jgi:hypothetical protein
MAEMRKAYGNLARKPEDETTRETWAKMGG